MWYDKEGHKHRDLFLVFGTVSLEVADFLCMLLVVNGWGLIGGLVGLWLIGG